MAKSYVTILHFKTNILLFVKLNIQLLFPRQPTFAYDYNFTLTKHRR